jgi:tryptophan 2,3-dioxygenase
MLQEENVLRRVESFPLAEFISMAREHGRFGIDKQIRAEAAGLYEEIQAFRAAEPIVSEEVAACLDLAERLFYGEWFIASHGFANYPSYICIAILKRALGVHLRDDFRRSWQKSLHCIRILLLDLLSYEASSLAGIFPWYCDNRIPEVTRERIRVIHELHTTLTELGYWPIPLVHTHLLSWWQYAQDRQEHLPLIHLTAFPVSRQHDEYFFIRVLQMSECCFWGALTAVIAAIEAAKFETLEDSRECMEQCIKFLELLQPISQALKTMPKEHFWAFRDATDGSSAIQSRWFHLLHIYIHGVDKRKVSIHAQIPEIRDLINYGKPGFVSLRSLLRELEKRRPPGFAEFAEVAMRLDALLYAYRCIHLGIVQRFLPPDAKRGTGGTTGIPYLRKHLTRRLWPLDSEYPMPDLEALESLETLKPLMGVGN